MTIERILSGGRPVELLAPAQDQPVWGGNGGKNASAESWRDNEMKLIALENARLARRGNRANVEGALPDIKKIPFDEFIRNIRVKPTESVVHRGPIGLPGITW